MLAVGTVFVSNLYTCNCIYKPFQIHFRLVSIHKDNHFLIIKPLFKANNFVDEMKTFPQLLKSVLI